MDPTIGDVLQVLLTFVMADGTQMMNTFTYQIISLATSDWDDVAGDLAANLQDVYESWMDEVSDTVNSNEFKINVRDVGSGQWNNVHSSTINSINGTSNADTGTSTVTGTTIGYPALPRYWGYKNWPPAAEVNTTDNQLTSLALAALLVTGLLWVSPVAAINGAYASGVYTLATETFRAFTGSVTGTTVQGTRVSRKTGVGW